MTNAQRHQRSWLRYLGIVFLILVMAAVGIGGWLLHEVRVACQAEDNFHATLFTVRLVEEFVHERGRWPASWEELERFPFPNNSLWARNGEVACPLQGHQWPGEADCIRKCVTIDFQIDPKAVATQDRKNFEAIRPIGPCVEYRDYGFVQSLQETLGQAIETKGQKKTPTKDGRQ